MTKSSNLNTIFKRYVKQPLFAYIFLDWEHLVRFTIAERSPLIVTALCKCRRAASLNMWFSGFIWGFNGSLQKYRYWLLFVEHLNWPFSRVFWLYKLYLDIKSLVQTFILKKLIRSKWLILSCTVMNTNYDSWK